MADVFATGEITQEQILEIEAMLEDFISKYLGKDLDLTKPLPGEATPEELEKIR